MEHAKGCAKKKSRKYNMLMVCPERRVREWPRLLLSIRHCMHKKQAFRKSAHNRIQSGAEASHCVGKIRRW
jgi:hypothetical protein